MKRIVDKGLLLAGGLLMAGQSGRLAAPVIALLLAMTAAAYGSCVDNRRWHCVPCGDVCGLLYPAGTLFFRAGSSV